MNRLPLEDQPPMYEGEVCEERGWVREGLLGVRTACDLPAGHDGRHWDEYKFRFWGGATRD